MKCNFCLTGKYHFCRGNIPIGVKRDGGFARFCIVPMAQVYELPKSVNLKQGKILEVCPSCLNSAFVIIISQIFCYIKKQYELQVGSHSNQPFTMTHKP